MTSSPRTICRVMFRGSRRVVECGIRTLVMRGASSLAGGEQEDVDADEDDRAEGERDRRPVVVVRERECLLERVHVRREVGRNRTRGEVPQNFGLVEELQRADEGEDEDQHECGRDQWDLDPQGDLPLRRSVDAGRLIERRIDSLKGGVDDDHVVPRPLPGDDVHQGEEDQLFTEQVGPRCAECREEVGDRAEVLAVQEPPHQRSDDRRDRVRQKDHQPREPRESRRDGVERERDRERESHLERDQHEREADDEPDPVEKVGVGEGLGIVAEEDELRAADEGLLEQAQVEGEAEGKHQHRQEDDRERSDEEPARDVLADDRGPAPLAHGGYAVLAVAVLAVMVFSSDEGGMPMGRPAARTGPSDRVT